MRLSILIALFLLLGGASILLNVFFRVQIPLLRIGFALFLIAAGISLLFGWHHRGVWRDEQTSAFEVREFHPANLDHREFNIVFGRGVLDLTGLPIEQGGRIKLNVIFSEGVVRYDPAIPLVVHANGAFSETRLPDGNRVTFGEAHYRTRAATEESPALTLEVSTVFGATRFEIGNMTSPLRNEPSANHAETGANALARRPQ